MKQYNTTYRLGSLTWFWGWLTLNKTYLDTLSDAQVIARAYGGRGGYGAEVAQRALEAFDLSQETHKRKMQELQEDYEQALANWDQWQERAWVAEDKVRELQHKATEAQPVG